MTYTLAIRSYGKDIGIPDKDGMTFEQVIRAANRAARAERARFLETAMSARFVKRSRGEDHETLKMWGGTYCTIVDEHIGRSIEIKIYRDRM